MAKIPLEAVYYYRPAPTAHEELLKTACGRFGARFKPLSPADLGQTVGFLTGLPGHTPAADAEAPPLDEELLLLHRFKNSRIDYFLTALRNAGVPKIGLKAVVTETNAAWTLAALADELKKERAEFAKRAQEN